MKNIDNFKPYFSNILLKKYCFTKMDINEYWENKNKEESFDNKKLIGACIGVSELILSSTLCVIEKINNLDCIIPIIIIGGIGILTTKISLSRDNPYQLSKYKEIDKEYQIEKIKYKKRNIK